MIEEIKRKYDDKDNMKETERIPSIPIFEFASKNRPQYTIAIPTYKRTDLLKFAIDSCLNQMDFDDYEILVVDNNPERHDETEMLMLNNYHLPNIAYYKNVENIGMTGNWNKLYLLARTEWVVMLHDDDMLYPDFMKIMSQIIANDKNAVCIYNCYNSIRSMDNIQPKRNKQNIKVMTLKEKDYLTGCHLHAPCGMTIRRDVVFNIGGFNPNFYPSLDYHFHVKLAHYYTVRWLRGYPLATYRWMVNTGGKLETLYGWIKQDNKIKRLIKENNFVIGGIFQEIYLKKFNYMFIKHWNSNNMYNIELPKISIIDNVVYYLLKFIWGYKKKIRKYYIVHILN